MRKVTQKTQPRGGISCIIVAEHGWIGRKFVEKKAGGRKKRGPYAKPNKRPEGAGAVRPLSVGILPNLLGYNVRRAHMALWRDYNRTVANGVVRPGIFSLMLLMDENPGVAQIELANQLAIDKATVV